MKNKCPFLASAPLASFVLLFMVSCSYKKPAVFPVNGVPDDAVLYGLSKQSAAGTIPLSKNETFTYTFQKPLIIPKDSSLELEYLVKGSGSVVLHIDGDNDWELPLDASLVTGRDSGAAPVAYRIRYALPVRSRSLQKIQFTVTRTEEGGKGGENLFEIEAVCLKKRWYGFSWDGEDAFSASPFIERESAESWLINPPPEYRIEGKSELYASVLSDSGGEDRITVEPGGIFFEWTAPYNSGSGLFIPPGMFPPNPYPLRISGLIGSVRLETAPLRSFPVDPIPADPGIVMAYRQGEWRDQRYEVFQWQGFPSVLIFDTANYQVQDNLFRRLAFFVEKAGYRGKLLSDQELAGQHGWNAHDYRAEDLAAFFEAAEAARFPLLPEENELKETLLANDILRRGEAGQIGAGEGAIISLSKESPDVLRQQFMAHEGFHGIFFIDQGLRDFSAARFKALSPVARNFILSFFDYQHYDVTDDYLVTNEFMAHVLQQNVSQAGWYFGGYLAARIEASPWRRAILPRKDEASATWPEIAAAFRAEAEALSAYVKGRWGFAAGRNWRVRVR